MSENESDEFFVFDDSDVTRYNEYRNDLSI